MFSDVFYVLDSKDPEAPGAFATVFVLLSFTGGRVRLSTGDLHRTLEIGTSDIPTSVTVMSWFKHAETSIELLLGDRCVGLSYNLVHTSSGPPPHFPDTPEILDQLRDAFGSWNTKANADSLAMYCSLDQKWSKRTKLRNHLLEGRDARKLQILQLVLAEDIGSGFRLAFPPSLITRLALCISIQAMSGSKGLVLQTYKSMIIG